MINYQIGINHIETEESRKFTLFHELAHLLLKKEGLSNFDSYYIKNNIEVKCNAIAGVVLVPNKNGKYFINSLIHAYSNEIITDLPRSEAICVRDLSAKFLNGMKK